jgi:hypothetical protein
VYIDYAILAVLSLAMCVYAYMQCPESATPGDDRDGGLRTGGDGAPVDAPPSLGIDLPDRVPETAPDDRPTVEA